MPPATHPDPPATLNSPPRQPSRRPPARRTAAWWAVPAAAVILLVTAQALGAYLPPDPHTSRVPPSGGPHYALLVAHIFTAAVAVLAGTAQFWPWLRRRHPALHRWTGRTYFFAGVFPSALVGVPVVLLVPVGLSNQVSLALLDLLWIATGIAGYRAVRQRRYADHRVWMIRNYALTLVAITSRLIQPLVEHLVAAQLPDPVRYAGDQLAAAHDIASTSSWLALVLNLIAAEYLLRGHSRHKVRPRPDAPREQPAAP